MHIKLEPENEIFVLKTMQELDCTGTDYVNSLITAIRDSEYTREFTVRLVKKSVPNVEVTKKIKIHRKSPKLGYDPTKL